jgi:tetratricopeptide (TPR) repeat protein
MKRAFVTSSVLAAALVFSACGSHHDLQRSQTQDNFGVQMARTNLWREAQFRFQRAVEINPQNAMAHNNLAVAYEANGDFENARKEYLEALRLDRSNDYVKKNYSRFVEFLSRNKKRSSPQRAGGSSSGATGATTTPAVTSSGGTAVDGTGLGMPPDKPVAADPGVIPRPPQPPNTPPPVVPPSPPPQGGVA